MNGPGELPGPFPGGHLLVRPSTSIWFFWDPLTLSCIGVVLVVFDGIMARYLKSLYLVLINIISLCREIRNEVLIN